MEKVYSYIITENVRTKHSDETYDVIGNFFSEESAKRFMRECVESTKETWADYIDDDWEEEEEEDSISFYRDDYVFYYEVIMTKKEILP